MEQAIQVTKTLYTVSDFVDWQRNDGLNLRPYFQRGSVWQSKAKSFLIDTIVRGFPIPIIYIQTQTDRATRRSVRRVVDGQQRLRTILAYVDIGLLKDATDQDLFSVMPTHNPRLSGLGFSELSTDLQDQILATELSVHVLPETVTDKTLLQIFARLNSTGTRLNDQELRNANFHGEFKTLVYNLSYEQIDRWIEWGTFSTQALAQMKEVEFLSDVVLMLLRGPGARTKASLDGLYAKNDETFEEAERVASIIPRLFEEIDQIAANQDLQLFLKPSWLYTLFTLIAISKYGAPLKGDSELGSTEYRNFPTSHAQIDALLRHAAGKLRSGDIPRDLESALRGASTDRASRAQRLTFLLEAKAL